jgi:type III restriction enzyme
VHGPADAYTAITTEEEQAKRLHGYGGKYKPLKDKEGVPYVCLRLPTGGGKTILAAHSITVAKDAWIEKDYPLVLWLVPTNTIRRQTVDALKNPRHAYRKVLDEAFDGRVRVFDIGDFTQLAPHDLRANLCVVVGTIQTLRVTNTDGRKVYAHHEMLEPHFSAVSPNAAGLERNDDGPHKGDIRFSFANLMHLHRPLVIMDEAHKAGSKLSKEVYDRTNPCALIEFTATPKGFNNILHSVSAQELKAEEMIKMPVVLAEHRTWEGAVTGAIHKRAELQEYADKDREGYIRPIVLFQAESKGNEVTVDVLKTHLIEQENIDPNKIAVATGEQRELDNIDLFKPDCPIEYVITMEALKEGWDCSFAYVFCSVANIKSATDAEQLLGRVLRMPYAKRRKQAALNKSYAALISKSFMEAATALRDKLVDMGFNETEAEQNIEAEQKGLDDGLFGRQTKPKPSVSVELDITDDEARGIEKVAPGKITLGKSDDGKTITKITGFLKPREKEELYKNTPTKAHGVLRERIEAYEAENLHQASPAELGETFVMPRLMAMVQGELTFADTEILMEHHDWSLQNHPARMEKAEFDIQEVANTFEIRLDGDNLRITGSDTTEQLAMELNIEGWTDAYLVRWLDGKVRDPQIGQDELLAWLGDVVTYLTRDRELPIAQLIRCKFILARKLSEKIAAIRQGERDGVYQLHLIAPDAKPEVSFENGFEFFEGMYDDVPKYRGTKFGFSKHFAGPDEIPAFDGKDGGEEEQCAMALDSINEIEFWARNVSQHRNSFKLPLPSGNFYPDFVAKLKDGRVLVVEYKGQQHADEQETKDTRDKRIVGSKWQSVSEGRGVFVLATMKKGDVGQIKQRVRDAITG